MAATTSESSESGSCCRVRFPTIPLKWVLFIDFAFTFGTTIVYFADIVTDIITLKMYYENEWYNAFGLSIGFIVVPSIILAIMECQFLIKAYGKNVKWSTVVLRTVLNVPFQLTVIWYHIKLSYSYMKTWLNYVRKKDDSPPVTVTGRQMSMSNLADLDDRLNTTERKAITSTVVPAADDNGFSAIAYPANCDHTWWKQLTKEQWMSHLNKMKLSESMLESLPQLLINLYLIVRHPNASAIQYISATLSYLSLCGGIVRYDKTRKDNEADRLMVDRTLLHSRAFATRLEWPQILFMSLYKSCFLAARILAFVFFTVYFAWYVLIMILIHWAVLMIYLVYQWYPTDIHKKTRQLVQADYKFRAYMFLSQDLMGVIHNSLMGIFISVRPHNYAFLGQPYCYLFWFYLIYVVENIILFLLPGVVYSLQDKEDLLNRNQYYVVLIVELVLSVVGTILCVIYYFGIHKMKKYTRNAYPIVARVQSICCCSKTEISKIWTVCKQAETSEIFYLRREKLKIYKNSYSTAVRANRKSGRSLECFIDERGTIFYARRCELFRHIPSFQEEEERSNLRGGVSRESLDKLIDTTPNRSVKIESKRSSVTVPKSELARQEDSQPEASDERESLLNANQSQNSNVEPPNPDVYEPHHQMPVEDSSLRESQWSKRSGEPETPSTPQNPQRSPAPSQASSRRSNKTSQSILAHQEERLRRGTPSPSTSSRTPRESERSERSRRESPKSESSSKPAVRDSESISGSSKRSQSSRSRSKDSPSHHRSRDVDKDAHRSSRSSRESGSRHTPEKGREGHRSPESPSRNKPVGQTWI